MIRLWGLAAITLTVGCFSLGTVETNSPVFCAAYFHEVGGGKGPVLSLFPMIGHEVDLPLPSSLVNYRLIAFSRDGKGVLLQKNDPLGPTDGIIKVEFKPTRQSVLGGSIGTGPIWTLTEAHGSGKVFVSGFSGVGQCGAIEIDPDRETRRELWVGPYPDCAGAVGPVAPDGKRTLGRKGDHMILLDLESGASHSLGAAKRGEWSPDGRWIAITRGSRIFLVDATNTSKQKNLGASDTDSRLVWSPDSKHLLITHSELRCALTIYFQSLSIIDVESGARTAIKSARCMVSSRTVGWIDPTLLEEH